MGSIIDRIRAMFGGSKEDVPRDEPEAVAKEHAVEAVQRDVEASREEAIDRRTDTPGSSDRGSLS